MGEFDGLKVKPEDNPFEGLKVRPEDLHAKSKYPQKEQDDVALGIDSGTIPYGFVSPDLSRVERELKGKYGADIDFIKEVAPYLIAGPIGKGAAGLASKAIAPAIKQGFRLTAPGAKESAGEIMRRAIEHSAKEKIGAAALKVLIDHADAIAPVAKSAAQGAMAGVASATRGTAAMGAQAAVPKKPAPEGDPKPYQGVFSNAIERLRASAAGNPRAAELLARIDGPGTVEQGSAGATP